MSYWLLQCNPQKYRIFDYWRDYPDVSDTWSVSRYGDEIQTGEVVFIWVSNDYQGQRERGIYARAEVVSPPDENRQPFEREPAYWIDIDERKRHQELPRMELRYIQVPLASPLVASMLKITSGLENMQVLKFAQRGIYKLSDDEVIIIESLIS